MKYKIVLFLLLASLGVKAQDLTNMSLKDCIDYAIKNQPKMKNALLDEQMQVEKNNEIVGIARPQVKATGQFQYLFIVPKSRLDANAFNFGSAFQYYMINPDSAQAFQKYIQEQSGKKYSEAKFGLPLNASLGVQASQILFDAGVLVALKARQGLIDLTKLNTKRTEEEIRVNVSKAYYNCVIANERVKLLDENIKLLASVEDMTRKLFTEGFAEKIDADRLTVQKNNLINEKEKVQNLIELGNAVLKFQMGMPLDQTIKLTEELTIEAVKKDLEVDRVIDYNNRVEMNLMQAAKKLNTLDLERHQKSYLPTVVAVVNGSLATQTIAFKELFTLPYFPTGAFVLSASMPLYDGNARKARVRQTKLSILKNENDMEAFKQVVDLESGNAKTQLKNSLMSLDNQQKNIELAQKVYDITQKKYKEGLGTNIEILQAETQLKEAKINYYNSLYDAIIAKIDFQKSLGLLK